MTKAADPGVETVEWIGAAGFERFTQQYGGAVPDPNRYRASVRCAAVDGVTVGEWRTSPVSGVARATEADGAAVLLTVAEGTLRYSTGSGPVDAGSGSSHLLAAADPVRFVVGRDSRFLLVRLPAAVLRPALHGATATTLGPVASTGITTGLTALVEAVLDPAAGGTDCPAARAVRAMAVAAVEDSLPEREEHDLRARILEHIEQRLDDPDLGPQTIADAFGISLRWVHQVFNEGDVSVARHIRDRRLDLIAAQLRHDHRLPRIGAIAARSGFGSRDQLTRAFRMRFGMTVSEYALAAAESSSTRPT